MGLSCKEARALMKKGSTVKPPDVLWQWRCREAAGFWSHSEAWLPNLVALSSVISSLKLYFLSSGTNAEN